MVALACPNVEVMFANKHIKHKQESLQQIRECIPMLQETPTIVRKLSHKRIHFGTAQFKQFPNVLERKGLRARRE